MSKNFYKAFEDKHRGSRDLIKERLNKNYKKLILMSIEASQNDFFALDIGCGRGEWLELINELGGKSKGVDLDAGMLEIGYELGLDVSQQDALEYLKNTPSESINVISAFHLIEHLPFESVQRLLSEALRILKPAGVLILEAPNTENIHVGTSAFYVDPTHIKPIPYIQVEFLCDFLGFSRSKLLMLQESSDLYEKKAVTLADVISGVSPDYAIVAQKSAKKESLTFLDEFFEQNVVGISLLSLTDKFELRLAQVEKNTQILNDVYKSKSWQITLPLRKINYYIKRLRSKILHRVSRND